MTGRKLLIESYKETGLLCDFLGIFFPHKVKNIIFMWRGACELRLNPCKVRLNIEMNILARKECGPEGGD